MLVHGHLDSINVANLVIPCSLFSTLKVGLELDSSFFSPHFCFPNKLYNSNFREKYVSPILVTGMCLKGIFP